MAATDDVAAAVAPDFLDLGFNIDDFDFDQAADDLDLDLAADEFCDAYSAFVANADTANKRVGGGAATGGWLAGAGLCGDDREGSREGSPESGVTDGPLAGDEAMSAYVAELERFLMDDGDGVEEASCFCPRGGGGDGDQVKELISADDFFTDLLASDSNNNGIVTATTAGTLRNGEDENGGGDVLAAREEDDSTSRKRARHKIKGTNLMPWWGELEVTRRHLARIQVPAPWPPATAVLLCCM